MKNFEDHIDVEQLFDSIIHEAIRDAFAKKLKAIFNTELDQVDVAALSPTDRAEFAVFRTETTPKVIQEIVDAIFAEPTVHCDTIMDQQLESVLRAVPLTKGH